MLRWEYEKTDDGGILRGEWVQSLLGCSLEHNFDMGKRSCCLNGDVYTIIWQKLISYTCTY
jgi:hypothetical protein